VQRQRDVLPHKDQLCVLQYNTHGANQWTGTYTNNRYFNPYNELSIKVVDSFPGPALLCAGAL
jgi:hypothetical protein